MIEYIRPTETEQPKIKQLYLDNRNVLSIPFGRVFDEIVKSGNYWIAKDSENVVGLCGIKFHPRYKSYEIVHFVVLESYRGQGIGIKLIQYCIKGSDILTRTNLFGDIPPLIAVANDAADNNTFYDRFSSGYKVVARQNTTLRRYKLDTERILHYGQGNTCK